MPTGRLPPLRRRAGAGRQDLCPLLSWPHRPPGTRGKAAAGPEPRCGGVSDESAAAFALLIICCVIVLALVLISVFA